MEKRTLKIALAAFVLPLAVLGSFKLARASVLFDNTAGVNAYEGYVPYYTSGAASVSKVYNDDPYPAYTGYRPATAHKIMTVGLYLKKNAASANCLSHSPDAKIDLHLFTATRDDLSQGQYSSSNSVRLDSLDATNWTLFNFSFIASSTIDFASDYLSSINPQIDLDATDIYCTNAASVRRSETGYEDFCYYPGIGDNVCGASAYPLATRISSDVYSGNTVVDTGSKTPNGGLADPSSPINWGYEFYDGLITPDFDNWIHNIYIDNGLLFRPSFSAAGYYIEVDYGTTTAMTLSDRTSLLGNNMGGASTTPFNMPISANLPLNERDLTIKLNDLDPGEYYAQAKLYLASQSGENAGGAFYKTFYLASTTIISFTITGGAKVGFPGQSSINCPPTTFAMKFPNSGTVSASIPDNDPIGFFYHAIFGYVTSSPYSVLDLGQGICKAGDYLLTPSEASMNRYDSLWNILKLKPPFGWFTVSKDTISGFNTSTPATTTPPSLSGLTIITRPIDYGLSFLVGFSFIFFAWHRLRKFDFHH